MGIEDLGRTDSSLRLYWWIATPRNESLEFLPSISVAGENKWRNDTWIGISEHVFENLDAYTKYNMTVYVRVKGTQEAFPPAKFFTATTKEGKITTLFINKLLLYYYFFWVSQIHMFWYSFNVFNAAIKLLIKKKYTSISLCYVVSKTFCV